MTDAPAIKQNASGVWMLEGEQLWDSDILPVCLEHIKEGDTVIDAGAWIGGHTMAYAKKVGEGSVYAFEPNPYAFECLKRNTKPIPQYPVPYVKCENCALGDKLQTVSISLNKGWYDSGYIVEAQDSLEVVRMDTLDNYELAPNFIKIDVEGCELKVLKGADRTIEKHRPKMVIEINKPALERQGDNPTDVLNWLNDNRYALNPIEAYTNQDIYNILCLPR